MSEKDAGKQMIPEQLHSWKFILLAPRTKIPTKEMVDWPDDASKKASFDDQKLLSWVLHGGNYGVVTGNDHFVAATDSEDIEKAIVGKLPRTFSVRSPRHKRLHFYFNGTLTKNILCVRSPAGDPVCDVKFGNSYVAGPGSQFKDYGKYEVVDNVPVATVTEKEFLDAINPFIDKGTEATARFLDGQEKKHVKGKLDPNLNFSLTKLIPDIVGFNRHGTDWYGPHPSHGSDTGCNFHIDVKNNVWHCFRSGHDSGGGPMELLAVLEGKLKCEEAHHGALKGDLFKQILALAYQKGLISQESAQPKAPVGVTEELEARRNLKDSGVCDDGPFEAVYYRDRPTFLVLKESKFTMMDSVTINGEVVWPKERKHLPYMPYESYEGEIDDAQTLFDRVRRKISQYIDADFPWIDVLTACVLLTYMQEKVMTVPYIYVYGDNESGKSTILLVLSLLCYRPLYGLTIPTADIYGYLADADTIGTILEDEIQGVDKDFDKVKVYKAGYKKGAKVPRTVLTDNDRVIKYFPVFCFKAVAAEQVSTVKGFNERFLFLNMIEGCPEKEFTDISTVELQEFYDLRNMLLKWRMENSNVGPQPVEFNIRGRIKELWKPVLQIVKGLKAYDKLATYANSQLVERLSMRQDTLEGHIVKTVNDIYNDATQEKKNIDYVPFLMVWDRLVIDLEGKPIENKPNTVSTSQFYDVTKNKIGYRLREILGGKKSIVRMKEHSCEKDDAVGKPTTAYQFDVNKVRRVSAKYGYKFNYIRVSELASSPNVSEFQKGLGENTQKIDGEKQAGTAENMGSEQNGMEKNSEETAQPPGNSLTNGKLANSLTDSKLCPLCHTALPESGIMVTIWEGKQVHISCYKTQMKNQE